MTVMILERVPPSLRGHLSCWLLEIKAGVFVGRVSALVRDKLWEFTTAGRHDGAVLQLWSTNNEQGYTMRMEGGRNRIVVDFEGLQLVKRLVSS